MTGVRLLPWLWALAVLVAAVLTEARRRPRPRRLPVAAPPVERVAGTDPVPVSGAVGRAVDRAVVAIGFAVLRARGARQATSREAESPDVRAARRAGLTALAVAVVVPSSPLAAVALVAVALIVPAATRRRRNRARQRSLDGDLPDVVDLFLLAVDAGLTVPLAVTAVAARAPGPLAAEFATVAGETGRGRRLADALEQIPGRTSESMRPLVAALVASERYGTPVTTALERLAVEVRISAQRRAEEAARRVPVTLLFPLVLCILPAFALLTVAPLVANGVRSLRF